MTSMNDRLTSRKGARRRSEIPAEVLAGLNAGQLQTANLVEWLAIDMVELTQAMMLETGLRPIGGRLLPQAIALRSEGIVARMAGIGAALFDELEAYRERDDIFEAIATHRSDVVRGWAAFALAADPGLSLGKLLRALRRFAADEHFNVRENAWFAARPRVAANLPAAFKTLRSWVRNRDPNMRRFAIEITRPRGVWCVHIPELKDDPQPGLDLLDPVRSDPSRYVQDSVANWLNDASKTNPAWVKMVCRAWSRASKTDATARITKRALRTITS